MPPNAEQDPISKHTASVTGEGAQASADRSAQLEARNFAPRDRAEYEARLLALDAFDSWVAEQFDTPAQQLFVDAIAFQSKLASSVSAADSQLLNSLVAHAGQLAGMIHGLVRISGLRNARLQRETIDHAVLVREVWDDLERNEGAFAGGFTIANVADAHADPIHVRTVWSQLLSNARRFARAPHRIEIVAGSTSDTASNPVYYVADNGIGITRDESLRLFRPFVRLHPGDRHAGYGLGLPMVRAVVERHGGRAWCESAPGGPTRFCFTLGVTGHVAPVAPNGASAAGVAGVHR